MSKAKRGALLILGLLFLSLGVLGVFLPLLPATPLMLLAAGCFTRSSPALYRWLMCHRALGPHIHRFRVTKSIPMKTKLGAIALLWAGILVSLSLTASPWLKAFLLLIAGGVTVHISRMSTLRPEQTGRARAEYIAFLCREFGLPAHCGVSTAADESA